jgi:hypothetical protein
VAAPSSSEPEEPRMKARKLVSMDKAFIAGTQGGVIGPSSSASPWHAAMTTPQRPAKPTSRPDVAVSASMTPYKPPIRPSTRHLPTSRKAAVPPCSQMASLDPKATWGHHTQDPFPQARETAPAQGKTKYEAAGIGPGGSFQSLRGGVWSAEESRRPVRPTQAVGYQGLGKLNRTRDNTGTVSVTKCAKDTTG